ncbi:MAG: mechanosensitive ion channel [Bdellovibrionaceae bacterium]|nr:mechanosensitive ion channel [Pseudobdellovibrionaceae bacterium]
MLRACAFALRSALVFPLILTLLIITALIVSTSLPSSVWAAGVKKAETSATEVPSAHIHPENAVIEEPPQSDPSQEGAASNEPIQRAAKATDSKDSLEDEKSLTPSAQDEPLYKNVVFREQPVFKIYYKSEDPLPELTEKIKQASANLENAMNASDTLEADSKLVDILIKEDQSLEVRVRGYKIVNLDKNDRRAAGFKTASDYKEALQTELNNFVTEEFQRLHIQKIALQFFLSVFFALMGFAIFHQIKMFFNRADLMIEEKRESLKPVVLMSETLISPQALGGLFALFLVIGRVVSYIVILLTTLAAILGQFAVTRTAMSHVFAEIFTQGIKSVQALLESLPGLLLAFILLFFWNLSLKILDLFLKGVRSGRISWSFLQEFRISVVRFWGTALSCVIFFPLIAAALFGRFNTPIEHIIIAATIILLLATLPLLVSVATGSFVLWQGALELGQWIKIGDKQGEITEISLYRLTIVPEEGGRVFIPMALFLFKSFTHKREYNKKTYHFKLQRQKSLEDTLEDLRSLFTEKNMEVTLECISLSSTLYHLSLVVPRFSSSVHTEVLSTLSRAHDQGVLKLSSDLIEELLP